MLMPIMPLKKVQTDIRYQRRHAGCCVEIRLTDDGPLRNGQCGHWSPIYNIYIFIVHTHFVESQFTEKSVCRQIYQF